MPRIIAGLLILLGVLAVTACGGDDNDSATPVPGASTAPAIGGDTSQTDAPAGTDPPRVTAAATPNPGARLYLALGDSLSAGIGASDPLETSWVPLVRDALGDWPLLNLGVPGDTSEELLTEGSLDDGLAEIDRRANDSVEGNEVGAITLEIGGNDLLDIYFDLVIPGDCPSVEESLDIPECVQALEDALAEYRVNLAETLSRLNAATDTPIFLMTLYNPFSGGASTLDEFGVLSLEGQDGTPFPIGLNDVIREQGATAGVVLVEWYELFLQKQSEYISQDLIHPNDTGHAVMADAVVAAMAQAGLPVVD
jgi:lysophospholipase L1-like esterase